MARLGLVTLFCLSVCANCVDAHAIGVDCKVRDAKVWVTVYYDDDTDAADAQVVVLDGEREIATGKTNKTGLWIFPTPSPGKYQVVVDAGAGHKTRTTLMIASPSESPKAEDPPSREEATRFPWLRVGLGLGIVGLVTATVLVFRRRA